MNPIFNRLKKNDNFKKMSFNSPYYCINKFASETEMKNRSFVSGEFIPEKTGGIRQFSQVLLSKVTIMRADFQSKMLSYFSVNCFGQFKAGALMTYRI
jgi:hypothetical protein